MPGLNLDFRELFRHVTLQTALGGLAVYVGAKQSGASELSAVVTGVISALTSGLATSSGANTGKQLTLLSQQNNAEQQAIGKAKAEEGPAPEQGD